MIGAGEGYGSEECAVIVVDPSTCWPGPTHTMASGKLVSFIVKFSCVAVATGKAIPSLGGRLGRLPSPATCWATVPATATQMSVGSSLITSVRCWVTPESDVTRPPEQAAKATAQARAT